MTKSGDRLRRARFFLIRPGAIIACCLGAALFVQARAAYALIQGSVHDFSATGPYTKTLGPNGLCSACHIPHKGQVGNVIWSRSLVEENAYFNQAASPNYAPGFTVLCYDCHDNHLAIGAVDDSPPEASFVSNRRPQDVAFDIDMRNPLPANNPRDSLDDDGKPGYYENVPSGTVGGASTYISGHYVKNNPGVGGIAVGDKLPCSDCHDPHSTTNQAFIRGTLGGVAVSGRKASTKMAYVPVSLTRDDADSRQLCIACHGTSDATSTPVRFSEVNPAYGSNRVAKPPTKISAHASTKTTACTNCHAHNAISVICSDCHGFPPLRTIAQAGGSSFDKVLRPDVENYVGGAGAHQRHLDALGVAIFQCEICHGPDPGAATWHNFGNGVFPGVNPGQYVDIMGESRYWDPNNSRTTALYTGTASGEALQPLYEFRAKGGGDQHCANLACHGDPTEGEATGVLTWTADMVDNDILAPPWENPAAGNIRICKFCHDATPSLLHINGSMIYAPIVMGNALATAAGFGAEVNGHGVGLAGAVRAVYDRDDVNDGLGAAGAAKDCLVCHDANYVSAAPRRTHFPRVHGAATDPRDAARLRDTINSGSANITNSAVFPTGPDQACVACHQNGVNTVVDGLDQSYHGIPPQPPPVGGYVPSEGAADPPFTRACRQCHNVHGSNWNGTGRNLFMVGTWIDVNGDRLPSAGDGAYVDSNATTALANITPGGGPANDNPVVFTHTNGSSSNSNSFDENDGAYNAADDTDDVCATCHIANTRGGNHSGSPAGIGDLRGTNCMTCHDHDYDSIATTPDAFMPTGCTGCHGISVTKQYWPDQAVYPDIAGAHLNHVNAIGNWLYGENGNTAGSGLLTDTTEGSSDFKQRTICGWCHPNVGAPRTGTPESAHYGDLAPADVHRDGRAGAAVTNMLYYDGVTPVQGALADTDATYNNTNGPAAGGESCSNSNCHNEVQTPNGAATNYWSAPPAWTTTGCDSIQCHNDNGGVSVAHLPHANSTRKSYGCAECHPVQPSLQHGNGQVNLGFTNVGNLENTFGAGNGFYDKNGSTTLDAADNNFPPTAYDGVAPSATCRAMYCHGGDNAGWDGSDTIPAWNGTAVCGTCHDTGTQAGETSAGTSIATGNHTVHLGTTVAYGPNLPTNTLTSCDQCHPVYAVASLDHVNGAKNMLNLDNATVTTLATTDTCNNCHGASTASAKTPANWANGSYLLPCLECHDSVNAANSQRNDLGANAPAKNTSWTTRGHGNSTTYPWGPARSGANLTCDSCHAPASAHINHALGNTNRLAPDGNALCNGCHGTAGVATRVSTHANTSGTMSYTKVENTFELNCVECHDVHGSTNIFMIAPTNSDGPLVTPRIYNNLTDDFTSFLYRPPGPVAFTDDSVGTSTTNGVGYARAGAGDTSKICQTCHTATGHYQYNSDNGHEISDCMGCHPHDFEGNNFAANSQDAFMATGTCRGCHDSTNPYDPDGLGPWPAATPINLAVYDSVGHGQGTLPVDCGDCHNTSLPNPITHQDHTYNSIWENGAVVTRNTNTAHLRAEFFAPVTSVGSGEWNTQVTFDNFCFNSSSNTVCHSVDIGGGQTRVKDMRHEVDTTPTDANHWSVQHGTHKSYVADRSGAPASNQVVNSPFPTDKDLNINANSASGYAPCISCHDPHGTTIVEPDNLGDNFMMRRRWITIDPVDPNLYLCYGCHPQ